MESMMLLSWALPLNIQDPFYRGGLVNFTHAQFAAAGFDAAFYTNLKSRQRWKSNVQVLSVVLAAVGANVP